MRWTRTLIPTVKQTPEAAEIPSHVLMLRAGLVRQVMAGSYAYLPLGLRVVRKAEQVVREEMDAAGAVEVAMPALTPVSLWERFTRFGDEMIGCEVRRRNRTVHLVLAPAHEEVAAELASRYISSYRQLPITLYQIQAKFRNEERPRLGVLRTCEFLTHDAYIFDASTEALGKSYQKMYAGYCRVLDRCGLSYLVAEAETRSLGQSGHEFMIPAANGEEVVAHCRECGYTATLEHAEVGPLGEGTSQAPHEPIRKVDTPGATTIEQVSTMLGCKPRELIKTLIYSTDAGPIAVLIRGDHEASEAKIRRALGAERLELASAEVIEQVTGAPVGFAGPVGMRQRIPIWADRSIEGMPTAITGANEADAHLTGVTPERDFQVERFADLRKVLDGDPCPRCSSRLALGTAIKVGRATKLGTEYSDVLDVRFVDEGEIEHPVVMASFHLGINRMLAALIETSHDSDGIIWPVAVAPYEVLVMPLNVADGEIRGVAERLHDELTGRGIDVLLDDRDHRAGVKFKDADLIGVPLRVVIGPRGLKEGKLEIKWRWDAEPEMLDLDGAAELICEMIRAEREDGARLKNRHKDSPLPRDLNSAN